MSWIRLYTLVMIVDFFGWVYANILIVIIYLHQFFPLFAKPSKLLQVTKSMPELIIENDILSLDQMNS